MFWNKKKKGKDVSKINTAEVVIKIGVSHGGDVRHVKDTFIAEENKDGFGGLEFIEQGREFKEEVNFDKEDLYNEMLILLEIQDKNREEQLKTIERKLRHQEKIISYLNKYVELNGSYNYADESLKQRDLLILYNHIKNINEKRGAFYELDENGRRVYTFHKKDGFFYPVWHGSDDFTSYPDHIRKKKIHANEGYLFEQEMGKYQENKIKISSVLILSLVFLALIIANMYAGVQLYNKHSTLEDKLHSQAFQCVEYTSMINKEIATFLSNEVVRTKIDEVDGYNELKKTTTEKIIDLTQ